MYSRETYIPENYIFRRSKAWALIGVFFLLIIFYFQVFLIHPESPVTDFDMKVIFFGIMIIFQIIIVFKSLRAVREKIEMTNDSLILTKILSNNTVHWSKVTKIHIKFEMFRYQRNSWLLGRRGSFSIKAVVGNRTIRYNFSNTTPDEVNDFLDQLTYLSRRAPKIVSPYSKDLLTEFQEWRWDLGTYKF